MAEATIAQLVAEFNDVVTVAFGKQMVEYKPELAAIVKTYKVPFAPSSKAVYKNFITGLNKIVDVGEPIPASAMPSTYKTQIDNDLYGQKVEVLEQDFERAKDVADLALYVSEVEALAVNAKEDPITRGLAMLAAGHTNTYGTAFDGKNFFATDHLYGTATGQGNLLSGHGITFAQIMQDLRAASVKLQGFYVNAGGGKKLLNKKVKMLVICPTELSAIFDELKTSSTINATDNPWKGRFDYAVNPFVDPSSWYVINTENDMYPLNVPILNPLEKEAKLANNLNQESAVLDKVYKWQVDLRQGLGYGAWYKAIKVDNSGVSLFTVQTTSGANGSVSPDIVQVVSGSDVEITLTAASGYVIDKLYANSVDVTSSIVAGVYTIENIAANTVIAATWKASA